MKPCLVISAHPSSHHTSNLFIFSQFSGLPRTNNKNPISHRSCYLNSNAASQFRFSSNLNTLTNSRNLKPYGSLFSSSNSNVPESSSWNGIEEENCCEPQQGGQWNVQVGSPSVPPSYVPPTAKLSLSNQVFYLLAFISCTTSVAFTSLVIAAVPTLYAMSRAAISLSKLADTAREELPSTMAAIRLSGMEISDLTLELSDLSQEIVDGVNKSAQVVQAAEAGIRQIGSHARQRTMSMIQERASLPIISLQPVVAGAAKKTSRAVGQATRTFMSIISRGEFSSENDDSKMVDRLMK